MSENSSAGAARVRTSEEARGTVRGTLTRPMVALKAAHTSKRKLSERLAVAWIRFASSPVFLAFHFAWFGVWILWNTNLLPFKPFDAFPFGLLTMIVSLEAIFLSVFVLIGQSREAAISELRDELTLQINLRIEAEVTKSLELTAGLYTRMGYRFSEDDDLREMLKVMDRDGMERELQDQINKVTAFS